MVFEKTAYWIAVGLLALVVSNDLANRHAPDFGSLPNRSLAAVEAVAGDATRLLGRTEVMLGESGTHFVRSQTTLACFQTRLASVQRRIAQREAVLARFKRNGRGWSQCNNSAASHSVRDRTETWSTSLRLPMRRVSIQECQDKLPRMCSRNRVVTRACVTEEPVIGVGNFDIGVFLSRLT